MYICYILPVPANDIAIENIFFYTFWHYCPVKVDK